MTNDNNRMPYGYKAYTGQVLSNDCVDRYNAATNRIQSFIDAGLTVPEYLLNGRHNLFIACARRL